MTSGNGETWITGIVQSFDNPFFEDSNQNAIDDEVERSTLGGRLLATGAPAAERRAVAAQWKDHQESHRPPALLMERLKPDRLRETKRIAHTIAAEGTE